MKFVDEQHLYAEELILPCDNDNGIDNDNDKDNDNVDTHSAINWTELEQEVRDDIINSSTIHFSVENDTIAGDEDEDDDDNEEEEDGDEEEEVDERRSVGEGSLDNMNIHMSGSSDESDNENNHDYVHNGGDDDSSSSCSSINIESSSSSPLEILLVDDDTEDGDGENGGRRPSSGRVGSFESYSNMNFRSPISLSILELEPLENTCTYAAGEYQGGDDGGGEQGIEDCFSPPTSRILDMILTPGAEKKEDVDDDDDCHNSHKNSHNLHRRHHHADHNNHPYPYNFKSRPAKTGVFVMNKRNMTTASASTFSHKSKENLKRKRYSDEERHRKFSVGRSTSPPPNGYSGYNGVGANFLTCRCTKTQCLKLYCDCFQAGKTCREYCECSECKNTLEESGPSGVRTRVIREILNRRPDAFQRKVKDPLVSCACKSSR